MRRGEPQIEITYDVDANGILDVTAVEKSTGKTQHITITNEKGRLSKEELDKMIENAEKYKEEDDKNYKRVEAKNNFETFVYGVKSAVSGELKDKLSDEDKSTITNAAKSAEEWLVLSANATTDDFEAKRKELETIVHPIMEKVHKQRLATTDASASASANVSANVTKVDECD